MSLRALALEPSERPMHNTPDGFNRRRFTIELALIIMASWSLAVAVFIAK